MGKMTFSRYVDIWQPENGIHLPQKRMSNPLKKKTQRCLKCMLLRNGSKIGFTYSCKIPNNRDSKEQQIGSGAMGVGL